MYVFLLNTIQKIKHCAFFLKYVYYFYIPTNLEIRFFSIKTKYKSTRKKVIIILKILIKNIGYHDLKRRLSAFIIVLITLQCERSHFSTNMKFKIPSNYLNFSYFVLLFEFFS